MRQKMRRGNKGVTCLCLSGLEGLIKPYSSFLNYGEPF